MSLKAVQCGHNVPNEINVVIEICADSGPVKYEVCKDTGALLVDRLISTPMSYPAHYGYVPQTLCDDGDPLDVLVVAPVDLQPGCVIACRPVGVLYMADEKGQDSKLIAVPISDITSLYDHVVTLKDLPSLVLDKIKYFFEHYKDLEPNKWVKLEDFGDHEAAINEVNNAIELFQQSVNTTAK
ncbi:MAG: inorganic diphosphatase [Candidatus Comchoanobacterales bacterium]